VTAEGSRDGRGRLKIDASRGLPAWLAEQQVSLAFTTYQAGKLFLLGLKPDGRLSVFERTFDRAMGLWGDGDTLWLSSAYQLWRFENVLAPGQWDQGFDRLYVPRVGHTTGDLDIHDLAPGADGSLVFVNTLFSCLATLSERASFRPLWRPPFVSRLAAEDRCHLNGLATDRGEPRYVTCVSRSDVADGWRDRRRDGGCALDVATGEAVVEGLSMPHSPRLHEGRLWLLDSGNGFLGRVDLERGRFEPVVFCPGYARGLAFFGNHAVVGLSRPREGTFQGLALSENLEARGAEARCGLLVVDLTLGEIAHWVRLDGPVEELYDVAVLPGVARPTALGFKTQEVRYMVTAEGDPRIWRAQGKASPGAAPKRP
jgi:uncharacterized protein (TIGR03032 family)